MSDFVHALNQPIDKSEQLTFAEIGIILIQEGHRILSVLEDLLEEE